MNAFGIEIRKVGSIANLYREVDAVLAKLEIRNGVSTIVQRQTVAHALQEMFRTEKHFDVCTVRSCAEVCQLVIPKERMSVYSSIHCLNWDSMIPDYRQAIIAMVLDDFRTVMLESEV